MLRWFRWLRAWLQRRRTQRQIKLWSQLLTPSLMQLFSERHPPGRVIQLPKPFREIVEDFLWLPGVLDLIRESRWSQFQSEFQVYVDMLVVPSTWKERA